MLYQEVGPAVGGCGAFFADESFLCSSQYLMIVAVLFSSIKPTDANSSVLRALGGFDGFRERLEFSSDFGLYDTSRGIANLSSV